MSRPGQVGEPLGRRAVRTATRLAARVRPSVPDGVIAIGMELAAAWSLDAPDLTLPAARRALVLAPHPDDESIGCGGTIARLAAGGSVVTVVLVTDGAATIGSPHRATVTAGRRRAEAARACERLGVAAPVALGFPDGRLVAHRAALAAAIASVLDRFEPELVLAPWTHERHADHRATTVALAAVAPTDLPIWGYEAHTAIPRPSHVIDITATFDAKRAALAEHVTAGLAFDLDACLGLARWRSLSTGAGRGAAEAFHVLPAGALPPLLVAAEAFWTPARQRTGKA